MVQRHGIPPRTDTGVLGSRKKRKNKFSGNIANALFLVFMHIDIDLIDSKSTFELLTASGRQLAHRKQSKLAK